MKLEMVFLLYILNKKKANPNLNWDKLTDLYFCTWDKNTGGKLDNDLLGYDNLRNFILNKMENMGDIVNKPAEKSIRVKIESVFYIKITITRENNIINI